jgi:hypothetical protein
MNTKIYYVRSVHSIFNIYKYTGIYFFRQISLVDSCRLAEVIKQGPAVNRYMLQEHIDTTLRTVSKNTFTALRWTNMRGPRMTANWNSGERFTACRQDKLAEWKWQELLDKMMSLNLHLQQLLGLRYSSPTVNEYMWPEYWRYTVCLKSKCTDFPMDELEM